MPDKKLGRRTVYFKCDDCPECQDKLDPECTYDEVDCTRHEVTEADDICLMCNTQKCRCEEINARRKYGDEA